VWAGSTLFEAIVATTIWIDVSGTRIGWSRTVVDSFGLLWSVALVAAVHLGATRLAVRAADDERASLALTAVPVIVGLGWLVAHQLPDVVIHAQNAIVLVSDPLARGWDLFGTIDEPVRYDLISPTTEGRIQLALLALTHVGAVLLAVRELRDLVGRTRALRAVWFVGGEVAVAAATGVLLLVGGGE
jgi:hypothetical protein